MGFLGTDMVIIAHPSELNDTTSRDSICAIRRALGAANIKTLIFPLTGEAYDAGLADTASKLDAAVIPFLQLSDELQSTLTDADVTCTEPMVSNQDMNNPMVSVRYSLVRAQVTRLVERGKRSIIYVNWNSPNSHSLTQLHFFYAQMTCQELGTAAPKQLELSTDPQQIPTDILNLLRQVPNADGFACMDDQIAMATIYGLRQCGRMVPQDAAVIGIDALPEGEFFNPPITSASVNRKLLASSTLTYLAKKYGLDIDLTLDSDGSLVELVARQSA
ncbi:MAG: substrate-binding domain-containing protein [Varibaculum sp.]|nr:substrate-binding domain-containing protein [Varibaculum sp.]